MSTLTDTILVLRYAEGAAEMKRSLLVLKMRGSAHDTRIRRFTIDDRGLQIGAPTLQDGGVDLRDAVEAQEGQPQVVSASDESAGG